MTGGGHLWKTGIAHAMGASRRFPTAAHHPWKTLRVSHIPTAPAILFSLFKLKNERPRRARRLTSVQAHLSMRICSRTSKMTLLWIGLVVAGVALSLFVLLGLGVLLVGTLGLQLAGLLHNPLPPFCQVSAFAVWVARRSEAAKRIAAIE